MAYTGSPSYPSNAPAGSPQANAAMPGYGQLRTNFSYAAGLADAVRNAASFFGNIFSFGTLGGSAPSSSGSPTAAPTATTSPTSTTTPGATTPREAAAARTGPPAPSTYSVTGTAGKTGTTTAAPAAAVPTDTTAPSEKPGAAAMSAMGYAAGLGVSPPSPGIGEAQSPFDPTPTADRFSDAFAEPATPELGAGVEAAHQAISATPTAPAAPVGRAAGEAPAVGTPEYYASPVTGTFANKEMNKFGANRNSGVNRLHAGVDLNAPDGSPAVAATGGKVSLVGNDPGGYDHYAVVIGDDGNAYRYATHGPVSVKVGDRVEVGDTIGTIDRGHLHFEVIPPTSPAWGALNRGQHASTQFHRGTAPITTNPSKFFGVDYGSRVTAGQPISGSRFSGVPGAADPFAGATTYPGLPATGGNFERDPQGNPVPPASIPGGQRVPPGLATGSAPAYTTLATGAPELGVNALPPVIAAAVIGNIQQESSFNPGAKGKAGEIGLGQWDATRWANAQAWAASNGLDINDPRTQTLFYSHELQSDPNTWSRLQAAKTPAEAAAIIAKYFERAGNPQTSKRAGYADAAFGAYGAGGTAEAMAVGTPGGGVDYSIPGAGFLTGPNLPGVTGAVPAATAPTAAPGKQPSLRMGSSGPAVRDLQQQLLNAGYNPGPLDGRFGQRTRDALFKFQQATPGTGSRFGQPDTIAGPRTRAALTKATAGGAVGREGQPVPTPRLRPGDEPIPGAQGSPPAGYAAGLDVAGRIGPSYAEGGDATLKGGGPILPSTGGAAIGPPSGGGYYAGLQSVEEDRASRARIPETVASTYAAITGGGGTDQFAGGPTGGLPVPPTSSGYVPTPYRDPGLVDPKRAAQIRADFDRIKAAATTRTPAAAAPPAPGAAASPEAYAAPPRESGRNTLTVADRNVTPPGMGISRDDVLNKRFGDVTWDQLPPAFRDELTAKLGPDAQSRYETTRRSLTFGPSVAGGEDTTALGGGPRGDQLAMAVDRTPAERMRRAMDNTAPGGPPQPELQRPNEDIRIRPDGTPETPDRVIADAGAAALTAPEPDVVRTLASLPPEGQAQYRTGFVNNIIDSIDQAGDARGILQAIDASPAASRRLDVVLGPQGASQFKSLVRVDGIGNREPGTRFAAALPSMAGLRGSPPVDSQVAARVGAMLDSDDPAEFSRGLKIVAANPNLQALVQRVDAMV